MPAGEPHAASYYRATCNDDASYAPLAGNVDADVCVIGGGFTGVSAALTLSERGYRVVLLEQHRVGWGATGRNGGQLIGGMSGEKRLSRHWRGEREDFTFELGYRGHDLIRERVQRYGIECDLKSGYLDVAVRPSHLSDLAAHHELLCRRGMAAQVRLVDAQELPALLGTDRYLGGLINNRNGHLHPLNLCLGEARAAVQQGAVIHEGSPVLDIQPGPRARVACEAGSVSADFVVLAGNAYSRLERRRFSGVLFPAGSYIIATEPLDAGEAAAINPLDLAVCDLNTVLDYFRLSADRRLLFGGRCNYSGREPRDIAANLLPRLHRIYPQLRGRRIDFAWGGMMGIVVNRVPLLGRIAPNVLYAMGYSGHGVNMSHACGEILADAIAGTLESFDFFASVPHRPIPLGRWLGGQAVAAGMLYYRLRDVL
ncbi:MAG: NAD(P)/FAD-dependent oxidoreductase [Anaerolineae bacterium]